MQRSTDGQTFTTIGDVKGNNNSNQKNNYSFTDQNPVSGVNYYQLKQVDNNGSATTYGPKAVTISFSNKDLSIYATPSSVQVELNSSVDVSNLNISVLNTNGQKVANATVQINKGVNSFNLPVALTSGVYILSLQGNGLNEVKKFVVKN